MITADMAEVLEQLGIRAAPGNQPCPECNSNTGLSINFKKQIAGCFACGRRFFPVPGEHDGSWVDAFLTKLYKPCRRELLDATNGSEARAYLRSRGLLEADYEREPIGMVPKSILTDKLISLAVRLSGEESEKLNQKLEALDQRKTKQKAEMEDRITANREMLKTVTTQLAALDFCRGWLTFFYVNDRQDYCSVNLRDFKDGGYKQIKPLQKGIFSPNTDGDVPNIVRGNVLLVEGEFNLFTVRRAFREKDPNYLLASVALGSASSWDTETIRKYFKDSDLCLNYDNDPPGLEAATKLAQSGSLFAFAVPTEKDADGFIKKHGLLGFVQEWSRADKIYRSWDSCREAIDEIAKDKELDDRNRNRAGLDCVRQLLEERGTLYNCGNLCTFCDNETHDITQVEKDGVRFGALIERLGIHPGDKFLPPNTVGKSLEVYAQSCPKNVVHLTSFYDREKHLLYVNEYAGYFLRIDGNGNIERLQNGDEGILFADGVTGQCDPLHTDLEVARFTRLACPPLQADGGPGLIQKHILDVINYSETGVGRDNGQLIIMTALLALFFAERIPSMPFLMFHGITASLKTSLCQQVGRLIQGRKFMVRAATEEQQALKDMAISIPFLVLDEANNLYKLTDLLKAIATGAMDSRRELFTTALMRHTPYQSRIWMTSNTASVAHESISSRVFVIDVGARTESEPYRSEFYLHWTNELRDDIWSELVGRLAATMVDLKYADEHGEGDIAVSHRMSSFFVFGLALAKAGWKDKEGDCEAEYRKTMAAMEERQKGASLEGNEIVDLLSLVSKTYNHKLLPARDWVTVLEQLVPMGHTELHKKVVRAGWVAYQFSNNERLLTEKFGMVKIRGQGLWKNIMLYAFKKLIGREDDPTVLA